MRQFPPDATLDRLEEEGRLTARHVEAIAAIIARFHLENCARAGADTLFGDPQQVWQPVAQNFLQIAPRLANPATAAAQCPSALERG